MGVIDKTICDDNLSRGLVELAERKRIGASKKYRKGEMLWWQDEPVHSIFIIKNGAVKIFFISPEGKHCTLDILGTGGLACVSECLLGKETETTAQAIEDSDVIAVPCDDFRHLLSADSSFSSIVMKTLAKGYISLSDKAKEFGFLDVQERLKRTLIKLAEEHGIKTGSGTLIGLNITHEEMGDLIAANRTTITAIINEFGRRGYIRRDGRYFVMVSPEDIPLLDNLTRHVVEGDDDGVARMIKLALDRHVDPISAFNALANGMRQVDQAFVRNEMGISDIILAAHAMKTGISAVEGAISNRGFEPMRRNKVVIGTVFGDIHDIGRTVVSMLLVSHNFRVVDLGANVSVEQFIKATEENLPCILAMSCLMTRSAVEQRRVIKSLKDKRLSKNVAVMVGGNAISKQYVAEIGANGYAASAQGAVELARRLTKSIKQ